MWLIYNIMQCNLLKLSWIDPEENLSVSKKLTDKPVLVSENEGAVSS